MILNLIRTSFSLLANHSSDRVFMRCYVEVSEKRCWCWYLNLIQPYKFTFVQMLWWNIIAVLMRTCVVPICLMFCFVIQHDNMTVLSTRCSMLFTTLFHDTPHYMGTKRILWITILGVQRNTINSVNLIYAIFICELYKLCPMLFIHIACR